MRQLHNSYSTLGKDFKTIFEDLVKHITVQRSENDNLRLQLQSATRTIALQEASMLTLVQDARDECRHAAEDRRQAAEETQKLLSQIMSQNAAQIAQAEAREARVAEKMAQIEKSVSDSRASREGAMAQYGEGMLAWDEKEGQLLETVKDSRDQLKTRLKDDWNAANEQSTALQNTTKTLHAETARIVEAQVEDLGVQMEALDDFVTRARAENADHQKTHGQSVLSLANTVEQSFGNISAHFKTTFERVRNLGEEMAVDANDLQDALGPLDAQLRQPLANLRESVSGMALQEYQPTGETPQKVQYHYPTTLPRTEHHDVFATKTDKQPGTPETESHQGTEADTVVFSDIGSHRPAFSSPRQSIASTEGKSQNGMSLREVNPNLTTNLTTGAIGFDPRSSIISIPVEHTLPVLKRTTRGMRKQGAVSGVVVEGRENMPPATFSRSVSRRKSPRIN